MDEHPNKEPRFGPKPSQTDFTATLTYLTAEAGGRSTPAQSGYRPQVLFNFDRRATSGQQTFLDREMAHPGDTVEAAILLLAPELFAGKLEFGMAFEFREGSVLIGTGTVTTIVNEQLRKND